MSSRNQSPYQYLQSLQLEHTVFSLRLKIYPGEKDLRIFKDLLQRKGSTIQDIANRNMVPHIFNDDIVAESFRGQVYNPVGFPNFHYDVVSPKHAEMYRKMDPIFYYYRGNEFRFSHNGDQFIGTMMNIDKETGIAEMSVSDGVVLEIPKEILTRVL